MSGKGKANSCEFLGNDVEKKTRIVITRIKIYYVVTLTYLGVAAVCGFAMTVRKRIDYTG